MKQILLGLSMLALLARGYNNPRDLVFVYQISETGLGDKLDFRLMSLSVQLTEGLNERFSGFVFNEAGDMGSFISDYQSQKQSAVTKSVLPFITRDSTFYTFYLLVFDQDRGQFTNYRSTLLEAADYDELEQKIRRYCAQLPYGFLEETKNPSPSLFQRLALMQLADEYFSKFNEIRMSQRSTGETETGEWEMLGKGFEQMLREAFAFFESEDRDISAFKKIRKAGNIDEKLADSSLEKKMRRYAQKYPQLFDLIEVIVLVYQYNDLTLEQKDLNRSTVELYLRNVASDKFILSNEEKEMLPTELAVDTLIYQLVRSAELIFNCEKMFRQGAYFEQQGRYKDAASIYFSILSNQELDFLLNNRNLKNDSTLSCGDLKRRSYRRMVDIQEKRRDAYQVDILRAEQALYQLYATESEESFFTERVIKYADAAKVKNSDVSDYPGYLKERVQYFRQEKQRELSLERRKKEARKEVFSGLRNDALVILNQISAAPELTQKRVEVQSDDKRLIILFEQDTNMISAYFDENSYNLSAYKSYHEKTVAKTLAEFLTNAEQEYFNEIDSIVLKFTGSADSTPFQDDLFIEDEEYEDLRMSVYLCDPYDERYPRNVFDFHKIRKGKKLKDKDLAMNTALGHLRAYHRYQVLESVMPGHSTLISPPEFCASVARAMGNKYRYVNVKMTIYIKDADNKVWETRVNQQNAPQRTSPN